MKKYAFAVIAVFIIGVFCSGCGKEKDDMSSEAISSLLESVPSPDELSSDIPSTVDRLISELESKAEETDSSVSSSTSQP